MDINDISKTSQNGIPDAKYYLVHPKDCDLIYVMKDKPNYKKEPFYITCEGSISDMIDYLSSNCLRVLDTGGISRDEYCYLCALGLYPSENTVVCVFGEGKHVTISEVLANDTYITDKEVAKHYNLFNWHIPELLSTEPFKKYIQEHLNEFKVEESKAPSTQGSTKESKGTPVILNKRLLI